MITPLEDAAGLSISPAEHPGRHGGPNPVRFALLLAIVEAASLALVILAGGAVWVWLPIHLALVGAATAFTRRGTGPADVGATALVLIATLVAGPAGALGAGLSLRFTRHVRTHDAPDLLAAWYERIALAGDIDPVTRLSNEVAMGRGLDTAVPPPLAFAAVMTTGSLDERQSALGLIARRFDSSYAAALRLALVSPEPVIRVQAAAVAVKVRAELECTLAELRARASRLLDQPDRLLRPQEAIALTLHLEACIVSHLLDDADAEAARTTADALIDGAADALAADPMTETLSTAEQQRIETAFLARGSFGAYRAQRAVAARQDAPALREPDEGDGQIGLAHV